jgi:hypothetical protein
MRRILFIIFVLLFESTFACSNDGEHIKEFNTINDRIALLEKDNAILKAKAEVFVLENDKKFNALTWPLGLIVTLLLIIFGIGAFRSIYLAKQEARKAFKEDFEKIKSDIEELKKQAEKELAQITTIREVAEQRIRE